jgi:hypothetical protein
MIVLVGDEIQRHVIKLRRGWDMVEQLQWRPTNVLSPWCKFPCSNCGFTLQGAQVSLTNVCSRYSETSLHHHLV